MSFFLPEVAKEARPFRVGDTDDQSGETGQIEQEGCGRLPLSERWTRKDDLGIVEIKESCAFAAVKRTKLSGLLGRIRNEKIKNMKAKFI